MTTKILSNIKRLLFKTAALMYHFFVTKDDTLVLFGAMNGNYYGDNSRHVFQWVLKNRPDLNPVWLTRNNVVHNQLKSQNLPVALSNSILGLRLLYKAKVALFTNSFSDFAYDVKTVPAELNLIALRHGRSVKRIRFARKEHKISEEEARLRRKEGKMIRFAISTSEFISDMQEECLQVGREKHAVTGYPRNDIFFDTPHLIKKEWLKFLGDQRFNKTILYGPSWRHGREATRFFPFDDFNKEELFDCLKTNQVLLLLRPHVNDLRKYKSLKEFLSELANESINIRFAPHDVFPDVNSILPFVDTLISDYSALYHDFLLLDRPLMFIPYDYKDFEKQNGFLYDYFETLPGPAINTFKEFCAHTELLIKGEDPFAEKRRKVTDKIHTYKDANSCVRVAALIDKLLEE